MRLRLVAAGACALACTAAPDPASAAVTAPVRATVVSVSDGDTVRVRIGRRVGAIDLLGVRAPNGSACFASQARTALRRLLPTGARVSVRDERGVRGRGRYVSRGDRFVNAELLRGGFARLGALRGVSRAASLRSAFAAARDGGRGLHRACGGGGGGAGGGGSGGGGTVTGDIEPGAVAQAAAIRNALAGRILTQLSSDSQSSVRNDTQFCADGRADRREELNQSGGGGGFTGVFSGSWAVLDTAAQPDGSIVAQVVFRDDDPRVDNRILRLVLGADGRVRSPDFRATDTQPAAGACGPLRPAGGGVENDTAAARSGLVGALTGARLEAAGRTTDVCAGPRLVRREGGQVVADAPLTVEWAVSDGTSRLGVLAVRDEGRRTSRRMLVSVDGAGAVQVQELARNETTVPATRSAALC